MAVEDLCPPSSEICTVPNSESPEPDVELGCSRKKKKNKKKRCKLESNDKSCESPSLQSQFVQLSDQEALQPLTEKSNTIADSENPQSNVEPSLSTKKKKKKKKKKGSKTTETNDTSCESPSQQPQLVQLSDQQAPQPLAEKITTITDSESHQSNVELSLSQNKKKKKKKKKNKRKNKKGCKTPETNDKSCESPSIQPQLVQATDQEVEVPQRIEAVQPQLAQVTDQKLEVPQPIEDSSFSVKNKKRNGKKSRKPHDCNDEVCGVSVGTSVMESNVPAVDPYIKPSVEISLEQLVAEPLVKGMSTTANSKRPKPNADFGCSQETKKKNPKRNCKTNENKELLVETMSPEADLSLQPPLAIFSEQEVEVAQPLNTGTVWKETKIDEVPSLSHLAPKADTEVVAIGREGNLSQKKLLILDINGLLADIVQMEVFIPSSFKPDKIISRKAVFKRPFCDDFLQFCFDRFNVGVWSSRTKENVNSVIDFLLGDSKHKLLFCWNQSHCTSTSFKTVKNKNKPLVLKELRKFWEKLEPDLPWARGEYNESNTVLLDDSPYKALCNPVNTAIFPNSYQFRNRKDSSLGPGGDIRSYLEGLAMAESVQKYVEQNPFGQQPITKSNPSWNFYRRVIEDVKPLR
ncbi:uncharacterized protein LOC133738645 [Rosa rugosa]|uniref:uncharacterized protein LOC133738645 n=1 Tax=Rosa rugosa TaxID=74645 RepID=UPI002B4153D8|nr:uncharacterized protein LOC133738645 [Rosa rugosa]